jgi:hypothetical protein
VWYSVCCCCRDVGYRGFWFFPWLESKSPEQQQAVVAKTLKLMADGTMSPPVGERCLLLTALHCTALPELACLESCKCRKHAQYMYMPAMMAAACKHDVRFICAVWMQQNVEAIVFPMFVKSCMSAHPLHTLQKHWAITCSSGAQSVSVCSDCISKLSQGTLTVLCPAFAVQARSSR